MVELSNPAAARAILERQLASYGLASLTDWAYGRFLDGATEDQIYLEMRAKPEYMTRFPAMADRRAIEPGFSEAQYVEYEHSVRQVAVQWGLPAQLFDTPDDYAKLIRGNVSAAEAQSRIELSAAAAYASPPEVREALTDLYGVTGGDFVAYWLEPDRTLPILQTRYAAAQVSGAGRANAFEVGQEMAERLAIEGVSYTEAVTGFDKAAQLRQLTTGAGSAVAREADVVGAQFGDVEAQRRVTLAQGSRGAQFASRTGQGGDKGVSGLASSSGR